MLKEVKGFGKGFYLDPTLSPGTVILVMVIA